VGGEVDESVANGAVAGVRRAGVTVGGGIWYWLRCSCAAYLATLRIARLQRVGFGAFWCWHGDDPHLGALLCAAIVAQMACGDAFWR